MYLADIGLRLSDLEGAADLAVQSAYPSPTRSPAPASVPSSTTPSTAASRRADGRARLNQAHGPRSYPTSKRASAKVIEPAEQRLANLPVW
jgi:hypothetical protein